MKVPFWKLEAIGNDFVVIENAEVPDAGFGRFAQCTCARRWGVGSDGLLVVSPHPDGLQMRMFNPDGTEDFCGNGLRCSARFGELRGWVSGNFIQWHGGRAIETEIRGHAVRTVLGVPSYEPGLVPHSHPGPLMDAPISVGDETIIGSALSTGSTHLVLQRTNPPSEAEFQRLGPALEHHPLFPQRTSVIWAWPRAEDELEIRIWERGVGETLGCGTGASAAAADHMRLHGGQSRTVRSRGGRILVEWNASHLPLAVLGDARVIFAGSLDYSPDMSPTDPPEA